MNEHIKTLFVVLSLAAVTALSTTTMTQTARAQTADWILNVHVNNVNFGEPTIGISVNGPYGYHDYQSIRNGPAPFAQSQEAQFRLEAPLKCVLAQVS